MSEGLNERRREKGLRPRPVRAAVVGFPNVGKSALINRLIGRAQCASAARPGVTRHLQWVSLGAEGAIMLLDAPGVLPMRLADQAAAVRLAICNDIGEASYTTSLVAAQFVELLRANPSSALRCAAACGITRHADASSLPPFPFRSGRKAHGFAGGALPCFARGTHRRGVRCGAGGARRRRR